MKPNDKLPKWVTSITRNIGYQVALLIIIPLVAIIIGMNNASNITKCLEDPGFLSGNMTGLEQTRAIAACMKQHNNFVGNLLAQPTYKLLDSLPNAPAEYVGVWRSSRSYRITLSGDGRYVAEPLGGSEYTETLYGSWGIYKNKMVWMDDNMTRWPPDTNIIIEKNGDTFILKELDGSRTEFTKIGDVQTL